MAILNREKIPVMIGAVAAAAITAAALVVSTASAAPPGNAAPAFREVNTAGKEISLADFKGKTVVLEWTNNGCPFVQKHYNSSNMQATQAAATSDGVIWLSVISSRPGAQGHVSPEQANRLTTDRGAKPTHVLLDPDGSMGRAYGAKTTLHMYIITPDGKVAYNGAIDSNPSADAADIPGATQYVEAALGDLAANRPVARATTQPYGCSVKY